MIIAEKLIRSLVEKYGKHTVYTDGGTWYDEACNVIGLKHYLHSPLEKSLMERVNQYFTYSPLHIPGTAIFLNKCGDITKLLSS